MDVNLNIIIFIKINSSFASLGCKFFVTGYSAELTMEWNIEKQFKIIFQNRKINLILFKESF